jgi:hypothetical protein
MQKWEYMIVTDSSEDGVFINGEKKFSVADRPKRYELLNQFGETGWELVTINSAITEAGSLVVFYLKRAGS